MVCRIDIVVSECRLKQTEWKCTDAKGHLKIHTITETEILLGRRRRKNNKQVRQGS